MATAASYYIASPRFSMFNNHREGTSKNKKDFLSSISTRKKNIFFASDQQAEVVEEEEVKVAEPQPKEQDDSIYSTPLRPVEKQINVKSKNMGREYGGQWLSSTTRHVRIFAAYIDPETCEFDQTQTDKLTIMLDPTDEFLWTDETCNKVYSYFQYLVDHYEGADLTEYTLRLIGSDIEHYIRKLLYKGEIQYNMNAKVLNFSMGKPRVGFNYDGQISDNVVD